MDSVRSGMYGQLFRPDNFVFGKLRVCSCFDFFLLSKCHILYLNNRPKDQIVFCFHFCRFNCLRAHKFNWQVTKFRFNASVDIPLFLQIRIITFIWINLVCVQMSFTCFHFSLRPKWRGKQLGQGPLYWGGRASGLSFGRGSQGDWKLRLHSGLSADSLIRRGNWVGHGHSTHFQDTRGVPWQDHELVQRGAFAKGTPALCNIWSLNLKPILLQVFIGLIYCFLCGSFNFSLKCLPYLACACEGRPINI